MDDCGNLWVWTFKRTDGEFRAGHINCPKNIALSDPIDVTIHWKAGTISFLAHLWWAIAKL
jgi:hypothetical protein